MTDEKWFLVELRCGGCGIIFCRTSEPVRESKVPEYEGMFMDKGPHTFQQCKNKCSRGVLQKDGKTYLMMPPRMGNQNLQIVKVEISKEDLQAGRLLN